MKALEHSSTPYSIFTHGMLDPWFNRTYPLKKLKKLLYWHLCEYHVLRNAANVIYTTEVERSLASTSFKKYKANEFVSGYGASSPSSIEENNATLFLHEFPHLRGKRLLLYLGRIHNKKGIDLFLKAFSMIEPKDNLHVVLAGPYTRSSPYYRYLVDLISRLNLSTYVTWCGMLSGSLKWSALNASYLFFLTSYQENFGVAVAEALSCKLPVLITDSVNISSIIRKNECGLVCAPAVDDIFRSLSRFLCLSSETKHRYSCNARKVFDDFFDLGIVARSLASIV
jgi:glycosyltransferase involved in cell wall biosynthesis